MLVAQIFKSTVHTPSPIHHKKISTNMRLTTSYTVPLLGLTAITFILHSSSTLYGGVCAFTTSSQQQLSYRSKGPIANRQIFAVNDVDGHQLLVQPDDNANDDNNKQQRKRDETNAIGRRWRISTILGGIATSQLHVTKVCKLYTYNMKSL